VKSEFKMTISEDSSHAGMLAQSVGDFVKRGADLPRVRALAQTHAEFDPAQWRQLAELGWLGVLAPESCGGLGLGLAEAAIVAEGLGRALTPEPIPPSPCWPRVLEQAGGPLRDELLAGLGWVNACQCWPGREQADDFGGLQLATTATPFEGGYRVSGG
jgi:alkylation response protein AidB-like acyl-CoA dehydrogenase